MIRRKRSWARESEGGSGIVGENILRSKAMRGVDGVEVEGGGGGGAKSRKATPEIRHQ